MKQNLKNTQENNNVASHKAGLFSPEILAPAGNMEALIGAINAGADAIYLGGEEFSARAFADNFTVENIIKGVEYAHFYGAKVYVTINTLIKNKELNSLFEYVEALYLGGIDGVIVQDLGVLEALSNAFPKLPLHASTQLAVSTKYGAKFLKDKYDVKRVVLVRELKLEEINDVIASGIETECFIHGSMCYSVSGQCLFSSLVGGRSGNRGRCAQSCRLPYKYCDSKSEEYLLSLKDMCTLEYLPKIIDAGITSLKIEGRMKSPAYAAGVTAIYRKYVDLYLENPSAYKVDPKDLEILRSLYIRTDIQTGYYEKYRSKSMITIKNPSYSKTDETLVCNLIDKYCKPKKIMLNCNIKAVVGEKLEIEVSNKHLGKAFKAYGPVIEEANNNPTDEKSILNALNKLGDTMYSFGNIDCNVSNNAFVPASCIKNARREAINLFSKSLQNPDFKISDIDEYRIEALNNMSDYNNIKNSPSITVFCMNYEQFNTILGYNDVREIAIPLSLFRADLTIKTLNKIDKNIFIVLPEFFRLEMVEDIEELISSTKMLHCIKGFYVNQTDSLEYVKQFIDLSDKQYEIRGDVGLYQNNNLSIQSLDNELDSYTVSLELNKDELKHTRNDKGEFFIYGRFPLMNTANCIRLSKGECSKYVDKDKNVFITDRMGLKEGVITHCDEKVCYNTIYNCLPTSLHKSIKNIEDYGFARLQIRFSFEKNEEVKEVLNIFINKSGEPNYKYTNGHFNRGVE